MDDTISSLPNLGPGMTEALARGGIHTVTQLRATGADLAYEAVLRAGDRPHFMAFIAIVLALQGRSFRTLDTADKPALRARYDAIRARLKSSAPRADDGLDWAELDRLGLR